MSWREVWSIWRRRPASPAAVQCEANIDDELLFHFRSLVDENLAKGMPADAAWSAAQERFGSLKYYSDECRRIVLGVHPMLQNVSMVGLVVLTLVVAWLSIEVRSLRQAGATPPARSSGPLQVAQATEPADKTQEGAAAKQSDLAGTIVDRAGKPVAEAHVLVILKTWPNNRYRQQDFAGKTDKQGRFRFKKLVPTEGQRAVQLAVVKQGYALKSMYEIKKPGENFDSDAVKLKLDDAVPLSLVVRDAHGQSAAKARVIPSRRKTTSGEDHAVYFQAAKPIEVVADAEGRVELSVFQRGDTAEIYIALPGKDWKPQSVAIPDTGDVIEVSAPL